MGSKKKRGKSGQRIARRVAPGEETKPKKKREEAAPVQEAKPRITERIQEKDAGFGVIKVVIGVIVVLIIGAGVLSRLVGSEESTRGDKVPGDLCKSTQECASGSICFAYESEKRRCRVTCSENKVCEPGSTCVSAAERAGRKSTRVRAVCIDSSQVRPPSD
jgi:hypothetical protein